MIWKDLRSFFFLVFLLCAIHAAFTAEQQRQPSERTALVTHALTYLGTPYRYGGRSAKGMDCSGFVFCSVSGILAMQLPRSSAAIAEYTKRITDEEIQPGDLLFFQTTSRISHTGIYIGEGKFIHSASDGPYTGVIISSIQESYWKKTYRFAGSLLRPEERFISESAIPFFSRVQENCPLQADIAQAYAEAMENVAARTPKK